MAANTYYQMNESLPMTRKKRNGLTQFAESKARLEGLLTTELQMTPKQLVEAYGYVATEDATAEENALAARGEFESGFAAVVKGNAALAQFLARLDG